MSIATTMPSPLITLQDFLAHSTLPALRVGRVDTNGAQHPLATLILAMTGACQAIAQLTAQGALAGVADKLNSENIQGETQVSLDVMSHRLFATALENTGLVAGYVSEEVEAPVILATPAAEARYLVLFDPLDGSSNVAVNGSVGTIFSVLAAPAAPIDDQSFLQPGDQQMVAGYVIYGPATMLVLTLGQGTHGFTLQAETGQFILTHDHLHIPRTGSEYAINASNARFWEPPIQRYIHECHAGATGIRQRDFNMRWVASMVADMHRVLLRGGIYLYPKDNKLPAKAGRLRLMYEANPISMLVVQAGGACTTGRDSILKVMPTSVHQRVPVMLGAKEEVALLEHYHQVFDLEPNHPAFQPLLSSMAQPPLA